MTTEKTVEQIAIEHIADFYGEFDPYTDPEEYMDGWKKLVYENPVEAYEYLEESEKFVLECEDKKLYKQYEKTLNAVYECILCNEEAL